MTASENLERRALTELEQLLGLSTRRRENSLSKLEKSDPELACAVRRLLARDTEMHDWMPTEAPGLWEAADDHMPERIGQFLIDGVLGKGGMGVVLRGVRDDGMFDQIVAIKLMRAGSVTLAQQERFILERQILARLDSPAVCRILDGGVWEGRPFLIMEHAKGVPLTQYATEQVLDLKARLNLFLQVCEAVQYAHRKLIVHADLKPSNIMVTPEGQVKLLDFGIARLIDDAARDTAAGLTGGSLTLTRAYAAPERHAGARPSVEGDVFSLGAILFELLTGKIGEMPEGGKAWPLASESGDPVLVGDIDAIIARAVASDPAARYPDVAALTADIEAWLDLRPVAARPLDWRGRAAKFIVRHRRGLALAGFVALLLVSAAIFSAVQAMRAERAREAAEQRFADVRALAGAFNIYDDLARYPGTVGKRAEIAATSARMLDRLRQSPDAPVDLRLDTARSYRRLAEIQGYPSTSNVGQPEEASQSLQKAEMLLRGLLADRPADVNAATEYGWVLAYRWALLPDDDGSYKQIALARVQFATATKAAPHNAEARLGSIALKRADAYHLIWGKNEPAKAIPVARTALAELRAMKWPGTLAARAQMLEISLLSQLGDAAYYSGDVAGALTPYGEADAVVDRMIAAQGPTPSLRIAKAFQAYNLSGTLGDISGNLDEALRRARTGIDDLENLLAAGPDSSAEKMLLILYGQEAVVLENMGRVVDALGPMEKGIALRKRRLADVPHDYQRARDLAIGLMQQARLLGSDGRPNAGCAVIKETMRIWADLRKAGQLSGADTSNQVPEAEKLQAKLCS